MNVKERIAVWFAKRQILKQVVSWLERAIGRPLTRREKSMMNSLFGNWRTTLAGLFAAIVQTYMTGGSLKAALASIPTLLIGMLAKDSHVGSQAGQ